MIVLTHGDSAIYEVEPLSGKILHHFKAAYEVHEAAISPDGATIFASVPQGHMSS